MAYTVLIFALILPRTNQQSDVHALKNGIESLNSESNEETRAPHQRDPGRCYVGDC